MADRTPETPEAELEKPDAQPPPAPASEPASTPSTSPSTEATIKQTIESVILALILAFVFRGFVIEAFIIPTGSMAPTLLGQHVRVTDPTSGYAFSVEVPEWAYRETVIDADGRARTLLRDYITVPNDDHDALVVMSPMTNAPVTVPKGTPLGTGDRILVNKLAYLFTDPDRWDVIVFKSPQKSPGPDTNFIKRVLGLPGESLYLLDGDVFVKAPGDDAYRIARKTDPAENPAWERVQRAMFQPIYHSRYTPLDAADTSGRPEGFGFEVPWKAEAGAWEDLDSPLYTFTAEDGGVGRLAFDFQANRSARTDNRYPYNQKRSTTLPQPITDLRLAADIMPDQPGAALSLVVTARLDRPGLERLEARFDPDGTLSLRVTDDDGNTRTPVDPVQLDPLPSDGFTRVELWQVDHSAIVFVNGRERLRWQWPATLSQVYDRPRPTPLPRVLITVTGGPAQLREVQLDRDVYYNVSSDAKMARGGLRRQGNGGPDNPPARLGPDDFYVSGDNTTRSEDSRFWRTVDPRVLDRYFNPDSAGSSPQSPRADPVTFAGRVPRGLIGGRAFFVYYPTPFYALPERKLPIPDFGRMRFIR
ncbi:MAG: S26 family signal peptidase [Planctomycetota bacterium]